MRKTVVVGLALLMVLLAGTAFAGQPPACVIDDNSFMVNYFSSNWGGPGTTLGTLPIPDEWVRITNVGQGGGVTAFTTDMCANIYVFDFEQEFMACCSCLVTPNGLRWISVNNALTYNPITGLGSKPAWGVIKIVGTLKFGAACDPNSLGTAIIANGLKAWGTHTQFPPATPTPDNGVYAQTETEFAPAVLADKELTNLITSCTATLNASGHGTCGCGAGD